MHLLLYFTYKAYLRENEKLYFGNSSCAIVSGSSTACVIVLNKETSSIYAANIGDSGFVVVRKGEVVHRSSEQQHYFNTPFQLSLPPPGHSGLVLSDRY